MKILVTGAAGLLGLGLVHVFGEDHEMTPVTRREGDITDTLRMREVVRTFTPDVIVHTAAIPDIDECERNPEKAWAVNAEATRGLVEVASEVNSGFALISTDAVFDGKSNRPHVETDLVGPLSVYGKTKVAAEEYARTCDRHWIFRLSVMFGPGKTNYVNKVLSRVMENQTYVAANDQLGSATYTIDAAQTMLQVIVAQAYGTYHVCNQGECTRYDLAQRAVEIAGLNPELVIGKSIKEMGRPGPRPKYAVMEMRTLQERGFPLPGRWEESLQKYVRTLKSAK